MILRHHHVLQRRTLRTTRSTSTSSSVATCRAVHRTVTPTPSSAWYRPPQESWKYYLDSDDDDDSSSDDNSDDEYSDDDEYNDDYKIKKSAVSFIDSSTSAAPTKLSINNAVRNVSKKLQATRAKEQHPTKESVVDLICDSIAERIEEVHEDLMYNTKPLVGDDAGLYEGRYKPASKKKPKIGSSFHRVTRIKQQPEIVSASDLASLDECHRIAGECVDQFYRLGLEGLNFDPDQEGRAKDLIALQVAEAIHGCCFDTSCGILGERLMQMASKEIELIFAEPEFTPEALELLQQFNIEAVASVYAWPTFQSDMRGRGDSYLDEKLREQPPDGFIKNFMNKRMSSPGKHLGFVDVLTVSPRAKQISQICDQVKDILRKQELSDAEKWEKIRPLFESVNKDSDNYDDYVAPKLEGIGQGFPAAFDKFLSKHHVSTLITIEENTFRAALMENEEYIQSTFRLDKLVFAFVDYRHVALVPTNTGHLVEIFKCQYRILAEKTGLTTRKRATRNFHCTHRLHQHLGLATASEVAKVSAIHKSYLMGLEGIDGNWNGSFRAARYAALPAGYCKGPKSGTGSLVVSKNFCGGTTANVAIFSHHCLGRDDMNAVLEMCGFHNASIYGSPLDVDYPCRGLPSTGSIGKLECKGNCTYFNCIAPDQADHPFHKQFVGNVCHRGVPSRTSALLQELVDSDIDLSDEQKKILEKLQEDAEYHRAYDNEQKATNVVAQATALKRDINHTDNRISKEISDPTFHDEQKKKRQQHATTRKTQSSGKRRRNYNSKKYNADFGRKWIRVLQVMARTYGQDTVSFQVVFALWDKFISKEVKNGKAGGHKVNYTDDTKKYAKCNSQSFDEYSTQVLEKADQHKSWIIKTEFLPKKNEKTSASIKRTKIQAAGKIDDPDSFAFQAYADSVIKEVYNNGNSSEEEEENEFEG